MKNLRIKQQPFFGKYKRPFTACIYTSSNEAKYRVKVPYHLDAYDLADCSEQLEKIFEDEPYTRIGFIVNGHINDIKDL